VNLLVIHREELASDGSCTLDGRRAEHLIGVLGVAPGDTLRAAVIDETIGSVLVEYVDEGRVQVTYKPELEVPVPDKVLCLAVPRPKALSRCIQHATALGFGRISLFRSYRVEKSHLTSQRLTPERLHEDVVLGMEQGRRVHTPIVELFDRFRPFVEDHIGAIAGDSARYVGHPTSAQTVLEGGLRSGSYTLVVGPDGGFIDYEIDALRAQGFTAIRAGHAPLRVESAISYLAGQLDLVHRLS
jgi:16S rRNA (uracil1498-N3)-methyltransferase